MENEYKENIEIELKEIETMNDSDTEDLGHTAGGGWSTLVCCKYKK